MPRNPALAERAFFNAATFSHKKRPRGAFFHMRLCRQEDYFFAAGFAAFFAGAAALGAALGATFAFGAATAAGAAFNAVR